MIETLLVRSGRWLAKATSLTIESEIEEIPPIREVEPGVFESDGRSFKKFQQTGRRYVLVEGITGRRADRFDSLSGAVKLTFFVGGRHGDRFDVAGSVLSHPRPGAIRVAAETMERRGR